MEDVRKQWRPIEGLNGSRQIDACLMCYPFYPHPESRYGIGNYAYELLKQFLKHDFAPKVITVGDLPRHMWQWPSKEFSFLNTLGVTEAEVYHGVDAFSSKTAVLLNKRPLVTTVHDLVPEIFTSQIGRLSYIYNQISMRLVRKSDAIIVPFHSTKDQVASYCKIPRHRIRVINYGVDHDLFHPSKSRKARGRILYVGELTRLKGVETLLRAFRILTRRFRDLELVIGGEGEHRVYFQNVCASLGLHRDVKFVGFIPYRRLPVYYNEATIFVWPSELGFGLTALQALACGTPVIAARSLDMPEFLSDAGLLFEPKDSEELAQTIALILEDDELRKDLSIRGLRKARDLSWEATAEDTLALYQTLSRR